MQTQLNTMRQPDVISPVAAGASELTRVGNDGALRHCIQRRAARGGVRHGLLLAAVFGVLICAAQESATAQSARWNSGQSAAGVARPRGNIGNIGNRGSVGIPATSAQPANTNYLNVAGIGRVPVSPRVGISPGHSAFSPSAQTLYYSAGSYSANRYGRFTRGVSRGELGTRDYWQSWQPSRPAVIVAPTWGFSPYGYSYFNPYRSYAGYHSSTLSVVTTPIVTPYNAHTIPVINPPCWYTGYGCANFFATPFCCSPLSAACGYLPGYSMFNMSVGMGYTPPAASSAGYYAGGFGGKTSVIAESLEPITLTEPEAVIPDLNGHHALNNEFAAVVAEQKKSSLPDKIHSLRYQASGDDAFRSHDFASAEVFYQTAIRTAPERPASYLRMAFIHLAQGEYAEAASWLKTGLDLPSDRTQSWVPLQQLYGGDGSTLARDHSEQLWDWVAERPLSTDRLLVAAAFQKLRGYDGTGDELLELLREQGEEQRVDSLLAMIAAARFQASGPNASLQSSVDAVRQPVTKAERRTARAAFDMSENGTEQPENVNSSASSGSPLHRRGNHSLRDAIPAPPQPRLDDDNGSSSGSGDEKEGGSAIRLPVPRIPATESGSGTDSAAKQVR